jgi:hypothetical protein
LGNPSQDRSKCNAVIVVTIAKVGPNTYLPRSRRNSWRSERRSKIIGMSHRALCPGPPNPVVLHKGQLGYGVISCRKHNAFRIRLAAGERRNGGQGCGSGAAATTAKALRLFMCVIKPSLGCPEEATAAGLVLLIPSVIRSLHGFRWQVVAVGCARTRPLRDCSILPHIRQMLANYYEVKEEMAYFSVIFDLLSL